ncbi:MAG: hypothetical protein SCALA702_06840 [Melioribacteraceae bacterium]|nr:MAG: hypothetical protein SCALA702_06840 [Melioribacteraceae bacterium]
MKKLYSVLIVFLFIQSINFAQIDNIQHQQFSVNNLQAYISNVGFYYNHGINIPPLKIKGFDSRWTYLNYMEYPRWGGKIDGEIFYDGKWNYSSYPGYIDENGNTSDPNAPEAGLFYLPKELKNYYSYSEYLELMKHYPVEAGAPWEDIDGDGKFNPEIDAPLITGDEMVWFIGNDYNSLLRKIEAGIDVAIKVFAYDQNQMFNNIIFKEYTLTNKSGKFIEDFYFGYYCDSDIGNVSDDAAGCLSDANLGFAYDLDDNDEHYGINTPVFALQCINPPANKLGSDRMSSFIIPNYYHGWDIEPYPEQMNRTVYNQLQGKIIYLNDPYTDPETGEEIKYVFEGNPYQGTGSNFKEDNRELYRDIDIMMNLGPYDIKPGESLTFTFAFMGILEEDNKKGIQLAYNYAKILENKYYDLIKPEAVPYFEEPAPPTEFKVTSNYPNPFNPVTNVSYSVPVESHVNAIVYDALGRRVITLADEIQSPGEYHLTFDGTDLSSGLYFLRFDIDGDIKTLKMTLLK